VPDRRTSTFWPKKPSRPILTHAVVFKNWAEVFYTLQLVYNIGTVKENLVGAFSRYFCTFGRCGRFGILGLLWRDGPEVRHIQCCAGIAYCPICGPCVPSKSERVRMS
jgi:hypothetical protein